MSEHDEQGVREHERAVRHRDLALDALTIDGLAIRDESTGAIAVVHALLAIEARIEELTIHLVQSR